MSQMFDFDRSVGQAWRRFALRLGAVLSMMDETEPLTLQPCDTAEGRWCLSFRQDSPGQLTATIPSTGCSDQADRPSDRANRSDRANQSDGADQSGLVDPAASTPPPTSQGLVRAGGAHQPTDDPLAPTALTEDQESTLTKLGWRREPEGFRLHGSQDDSDAMAQAAVDALRQVFRVEHPVFLDSNVLAEVLQEPGAIEEQGSNADLATAQVYAGLDEVQLSAAVADELAAVCGTAVMRDQDGDFAVRVGSTMLFVRVPSDGKEIRLFAVLVRDISGRSRAAEVLNDVNAHSRWVRFYAVRDRILVTMSIFASPYVPAHLRQAITEMRNISDGVDDLLASSLQGRTTFSD